MKRCLKRHKNKSLPRYVNWFSYLQQQQRKVHFYTRLVLNIFFLQKHSVFKCHGVSLGDWDLQIKLSTIWISSHPNSYRIFDYIPIQLQKNLKFGSGWIQSLKLIMLGLPLGCNVPNGQLNQFAVEIFIISIYLSSNF